MRRLTTKESGVNTTQRQTSNSASERTIRAERKCDLAQTVEGISTGQVLPQLFARGAQRENNCRKKRKNSVQDTTMRKKPQSSSNMEQSTTRSSPRRNLKQQISRKPNKVDFYASGAHRSVDSRKINVIDQNITVFRRAQVLYEDNMGRGIPSAGYYDLDSQRECAKSYSAQ